MEFIPFKEDELLEVPCKIKIGDTEMETTFITVPLCGKNEVQVMKIFDTKDRPQYEIFAEIFDYLCKGYISNGNRIMFTDENKGSQIFNYTFTKWFVSEMYCFNVLCTNQKKS